MNMFIMAALLVDLANQILTCAKFVSKLQVCLFHQRTIEEVVLSVQYLLRKVLNMTTSVSFLGKEEWEIIWALY